MDQSLLNRTIAGQRRLTVPEASRLSTVLSVPVDEILARFGQALKGELSSASGLKRGKVSGWLDERLMLRTAKEGKIAGDTHVTLPPHEDPKGIEIARCQTAGSEFDGLDGALVYWKPARSGKFDLGSVGRIVMVKIHDDEQLRLRIVRRGYAAGRYNLTSLSGKMMEEGVAIESTSEVVWLKL